MKHVTIYSDGACSYNPGPGGWGVVLLFGKHEKELSGFVEETTNNRMEMTAVIKGLQALKKPCNVTVYTDSAYIHNAYQNGWLLAWERNGWVNSKKEPVKNKDLWMELDNLTKDHKVSWVKVKGHSDNVNNNRCDKLATDEVKRYLKNTQVKERSINQLEAEKESNAQ